MRRRLYSDPQPQWDTSHIGPFGPGIRNTLQILKLADSLPQGLIRIQRICSRSEWVLPYILQPNLPPSSQSFVLYSISCFPAELLSQISSEHTPLLLSGLCLDNPFSGHAKWTLHFPGLYLSTLWHMSIIYLLHSLPHYNVMSIRAVIFVLACCFAYSISSMHITISGI